MSRITVMQKVNDAIYYREDPECTARISQAMECSPGKKEDYKRVGAQYPDKFIQVRNRRQLRATVIRLLQLQNEKGLYAGTGSRKR